MTYTVNPGGISQSGNYVGASVGNNRCGKVLINPYSSVICSKCHKILSPVWETVPECSPADRQYSSFKSFLTQYASDLSSVERNSFGRNLLERNSLERTHLNETYLSETHLSECVKLSKYSMNAFMIKGIVWC